jgi:hypothetical protein
MSNRNKRPAGLGLRASEWLSIFHGAGVETERLEATKSEQGRATIIGSYLARMVNREVRIEVDGRSGKATLRTGPGRGGKNLYWFEVAFDDREQAAKNDSPQLRRDFIQNPTTQKPVTNSSTSPIDRSPAKGMLSPANDEAW